MLQVTFRVTNKLLILQQTFQSRPLYWDIPNLKGDLHFYQLKGFSILSMNEFINLKWNSQMYQLKGFSQIHQFKRVLSNVSIFILKGYC